MNQCDYKMNTIEQVSSKSNNHELQYKFISTSVELIFKASDNEDAPDKPMLLLTRWDWETIKNA